MGWIIHMAKTATTKIIVLAGICLIASAIAWSAESGMVRNCTWCHGGSAQGYSPAPRLAGQRAPYIFQQSPALSITLGFLWRARLQLFETSA